MNNATLFYILLSFFIFVFFLDDFFMFKYFLFFLILLRLVLNTEGDEELKSPFLPEGGKNLGRRQKPSAAAGSLPA